MKRFPFLIASCSDAIAGVMARYIWQRDGWAARLTVISLLARSLRIDVPFALVWLAGALGILASLLPVSFSGLGPREGAVVFFLGRAGVPVGSTFALSLLYFALGLLSVLVPAGGYFLGSAIRSRSRGPGSRPVQPPAA